MFKKIMFGIYAPFVAEASPAEAAADLGVIFSSVHDVNVAIEAMVRTRM